MADQVYFQVKKNNGNFPYQQHDHNIIEGLLNNQQRRQLQHEFKVHAEKYFKDLLGKSSDYAKTIIWNNIVVIQGEGFLTEPEKYIAREPKGNHLISLSRQQLAKQFADENLPYFEARLGANCIYQSFDVDAKKRYVGSPHDF